MNDFITGLINKIPPILRSRYFLTFLVFLVWIMLFDNNNLIDRYHMMKELRQLENDRDYYQNRIKEDRRKLKELKTSDRNLEKFAREQYYMKKDNEDLYILVDEEGNKIKDPSED
ncbi:MAG: septum formation initiator family protein [Bacteroidales bacterium]|nr:septum formation initiator family protein [Bacteroidales bacterium]